MSFLAQGHEEIQTWESTLNWTLDENWTQLLFCPISYSTKSKGNSQKRKYLKLNPRWKFTTNIFVRLVEAQSEEAIHKRESIFTHGVPIESILNRTLDKIKHYFLLIQLLISSLAQGHEAFHKRKSSFDWTLDKNWTQLLFCPISYRTKS